MPPSAVTPTAATRTAPGASLIPLPYQRTDYMSTYMCDCEAEAEAELRRQRGRVASAETGLGVPSFFANFVFETECIRKIHQKFCDIRGNWRSSPRHGFTVFKRASSLERYCKREALHVSVVIWEHRRHSPAGCSRRRPRPTTIRVMARRPRRRPRPHRDWDRAAAGLQ